MYGSLSLAMSELLFNPQQVYATLLPSSELLSDSAKASVSATLACMLQLHENILGQLYTAIPNAEYNQRLARDPPVFRMRSHVRWHSTDSISSRFKDSRLARKLRHSLDLSLYPKEYPLGSVTEPLTATAVAKIFSSTVGDRHKAS